MTGLGAVSYSDLPSSNSPAASTPRLSSSHDLHQRPFPSHRLHHRRASGLRDYRKRGLVVLHLGASHVLPHRSLQLPLLARGLLIMIATSPSACRWCSTTRLPLMVDDYARAAARRGARYARRGRVRAREAISSEYFKGRCGVRGGTTCLIFRHRVAVLVVGSASIGRGRRASAPGFGGWVFVSGVRPPDRPGRRPRDEPVPRGGFEPIACCAHLATTPTRVFLLFFFFSGGYATIATVSVLFAAASCAWDGGAALLAVLVPSSPPSAVRVASRSNGMELQACWC